MSSAKVKQEMTPWTVFIETILFEQQSQETLESSVPSGLSAIIANLSLHADIPLPKQISQQLAQISAIFILFFAMRSL